MRGTGISERVIGELSQAARSCGVRRLVLFGSRARGEHRPKSDIDLAVEGGDFARFCILAEEGASTLLSFDFARMGADASPELMRRIEEEGATIYEEAR